MLHKIVLAFSLLLSGLALGQATLNVPSPAFPTIQVAITAAQNGDTVQVAPGTYVETINFLGKAISVVSTQGSEATIIQANSTSRVVSFVTGETQFSVLDGFTVERMFSFTNSSVGFARLYDQYHVSSVF